jgi:iron complex outermembrane receptor protein
MHITNPLIKTVLLTCITAVGSNALAQLEEVIVTATKREQSMQDIPVSVNAITETTVQEAGINDVGDVAQLVPSLTVSTNLSPFATALRIRGMGTAQNDPSLEASVAFILDGIYMGRSGLGMSDLTDVERIEVLQGPQGTLYGKNSNAGVVSVITKKPNTEETEGYVEATAGDYSLQKYVGSVSGPVTDSLAYRLSGQWHKRDGWIDNNTGDDPNEIDDWNATGKIQWLPTDSLSILVSGSHVDRDTSCCGTDATQTAAVTDELIAQGLEVLKNDAFDYKNNTNVDSNFDLTADAINVAMDYEFDSATLTSLSAWNDYDYKTSYDADASELDVLAIVNDKYTGEMWSQELRLTSELEGPLQYMAGFFFAYEELTRGKPAGNLQVGDDIIAVGGAATGTGANFGLAAQAGDNYFMDNKWETETYAVFGQTTYSFSDDWEATVGLRYTTETKDADLYTEPVSSAALFPTGGTLVQRAFGAIDDSFNREKDGFTGLASLSYFVTEGTMIFTTVSTGSKSGGFNGVAGEGARREFDDEETINYELGIKSELFDNRLQLNATAFYTEFDDLQYLAQQASGVGLFVDNGDAETRGVDMNFSAAPWDFLRLSGGLQYLDAENTSGQLDDNDLDVANAPDWSANLAATVLLPLFEGVSYLRGDYSYMGDHYTNAVYQASSTKQDKEIVNARLGWRNDNWDAALWVKNATDEEYASLSNAPITFTGTEAEFLQAPRTYGATVRYSF